MNIKNNEKNMKLVRSNHYFQKWQIDWMEVNRKNTGTSAAELLRGLLNEYIEKRNDKRRENS